MPISQLTLAPKADDNLDGLLLIHLKLDEDPSAGNLLDTAALGMSFDGVPVSLTADESIAGKVGNSIAFDGAADYIKIDRNSVGWIMPAGGTGSAQFTNTGLCYDATFDGFWIGDFSGDRLVKTSKTGVFLGEIALAADAEPQGVCVDTSDDTLWWVDKGGQDIVHINKDGTSASAAAGFTDIGFAPNGVSYDADTASLWIVDGTATDEIKRYLISDGLLKDTVSPTYTTPNIDGVFYTGESGAELLITDDGDNALYWINKADGVIARATGANSEPEGPCIVNGIVYYNRDPGGSGNRLHANICDYIATSDFTMSAWVSPIDNSATDQIFGFDDATSDEGVGLYLTDTPTSPGACDVKVIVKDDQPVSVTSAAYEIGAVGVKATPVWSHVSVAIDRTNGEARVYYNGVLAGAATDISTVTGRIIGFSGPTIGCEYDRATTERFSEVGVDEFRVYSKAANATDAQTIYLNSGGT